MGIYRKKPVVVEAVRVSEALAAARDDWQALPEWLREAYERGEVIFAPGFVYVKTLEGSLSAGREDWIIRGIKGELYPCKPDIFAETYVEET